MKVKLYVHEGRVQCPRRGDIDVEVCLGCPELAEIRTNRRGDEILECTPAVHATRLDPLYQRW